MSITVIVSLFLLSIGASFVQRVCGFGFGVFIMTMLPFLCPSYGEATTLSGLLSAAQSFWMKWWNLWAYPKEEFETQLKK